MKRWARACLVISLSLSAPRSRAAAQTMDLDEFLKPTAKAAAPSTVEASEVLRAKAPPAASAHSPAATPKAAAGQTTPPARTSMPLSKPALETSEAAPAATAAKSDSEPAPTRGHGPSAPASLRDHATKLPRADKPKRVKKKTAYDLLCESWHASAEPELVQQWRASAVPDLVFRVHKTGETYTLKPASLRGGFDETQLQIAKAAFQSWGPTPHPRTLDLVYAAALHFNAPYVTLISGVRKDRGGSRHSHGLAADVVLPGIDDETLAAFFRAQGFCGVGTYPRSGFVHVDTRDASYFWIDSSKPNQHGRVVQVRKEESAAADAAALARGASFVNPPKLQKALNVRLIRKRKLHRAKLERAAVQSATAVQPKTPVPN